MRTLNPTSYLEYGKKIFGIDLAGGVTIARPRKKYVVEVEVEIGEDGVPKLPKEEESDEAWNLETKKLVIRKFLNAHQRKSFPANEYLKLTIYTGQASKGRCKAMNWDKVSGNTDTFFDDEYWPEDVAFREPSHLTKRAVEAIFQHWYDRQDSQDVPFMLKAWTPPNNATELHDAEYTPPKTSDETAEKSTGGKKPRGKKQPDGSSRRKTAKTKGKGKGKAKSKETVDDEEHEVIQGLDAFSDDEGDEGEEQEVDTEENARNRNRRKSKAKQPEVIDDESPAAVGNSRAARASFLTSLVKRSEWMKLVMYYEGLKVYPLYSTLVSANRSDCTQAPDSPNYTLAEFQGTDWATWEYRSKYAPITVHTDEGHIQDMVAFFNGTGFLDADLGVVTDDIRIVEKYLLTVGLFRRDLYTGQFTEDEDDIQVPGYVVNPAYDFDVTDSMISDLITRMSDALPPILPILPYDMDYNIIDQLANGIGLGPRPGPSGIGHQTSHSLFSAGVPSNHPGGPMHNTTPFVSPTDTEHLQSRPAGNAPDGSPNSSHPSHNPVVTPLEQNSRGGGPDINTTSPKATSPSPKPTSPSPTGPESMAQDGDEPDTDKQESGDTQKAGTTQEDSDDEHNATPGPSKKRPASNMISDEQEPPAKVSR